MTGGEARPWPIESVTSSHDVETRSSEANMSKQQAKDDYTSGYMPGMESKKKKGFFSKIFNRKRGDTFKVASIPICFEGFWFRNCSWCFARL